MAAKFVSRVLSTTNTACKTASFFNTAQLSLKNTKLISLESKNQTLGRVLSSNYTPPLSFLNTQLSLGFLRPFQRRGFCGVPPQGMRTKDFGALTSKLPELKNVPRPYPNFMFPSAYVTRGGLPVNEVVSRDCPTQIGPMVYDLRIDVWPDPFCWMLHGIWPAYVSGYWLVHYKLEGLKRSELYLMKEKVKLEILKLDFNTKETLHEIWKSYGDFYEDPREQDMEFWAYQKVMHCWDLLNCPPGQYFYVMANVGKYVRDTLVNWTTKSNYKPNQFYTSDAIRLQMEFLFGVSVYLIVKADDDMVYDPASTKIPFLHSLGIMMVKDPMQMHSYNFHDHPSGLYKVPRGSLFLLM